MNASTTAPFDAIFGKDMGVWFLNAMEQGIIQAFRMIWSAVKPLLVEHWLMIILVLFALFVIFFAEAMIGYWGSLGSLIYNTLYFGTLLIVILIWGTDIFVNDYFKLACAVILYPTCYFISGWALDKFGFRRR